ncbi:MAG: hypothetical protein ACON38_12685 [Akkermansiaceae bacterium]
MNKRSAIFAGAWALTCGVAFFAGRTSVESPASTNNAGSNQESLSQRSAASGGASSSPGDTNSLSGNRFRNSGSPSGEEAQLKEAVLELTRMTDPIARAEGFLQLVKDLSPDQFLTVVDTYRSEGVNEEDFGEYRILLTAWAKAAPLEALAYAKDNTGTPLARQTILATWAQSDPASAIAWARENFDPESRDDRANPWLVGVIEGIASTDLSQATALLEELPYSRGRGEALSAIFEEITQLGTDAGKNWVNDLKDPQLQAGAAARLAGLMAETDPKAAADWASSLSPDAMKRSAEAIVDRWVEEDLEAAKSWVESQPEEVIAAAGPELIKGILDQQDPAAASEWLSSYDGNPAFDDTIRTLVWSTMNETPELGADWIMRLSSENDQTRTFHRVLRGWMGKDSSGAMDYIQNNPVPESILRRAEMEMQQRQEQK